MVLHQPIKKVVGNIDAFFGVDPFAGSSVPIDKPRDEMERQGISAAHATYVRLAAANPRDPWAALAVLLGQEHSVVNLPGGARFSVPIATSSRSLWQKK
jgi:hypothetical protein